MCILEIPLYRISFFALLLPGPSDEGKLRRLVTLGIHLYWISLFPLSFTTPSDEGNLRRHLIL